MTSTDHTFINVSRTREEYTPFDTMYDKLMTYSTNRIMLEQHFNEFDLDTIATDLTKNIEYKTQNHRREPYGQ